MVLYMIALVFIMGPRCSTLPPSEMIGIIGNGNSAIIINGVSYNISSIITTAADVMLKKYRSGWVFLAFALVSLTIISTLLLIRILLMRGNGNNRKSIRCDKKHRVKKLCTLFRNAVHYQTSGLLEECEGDVQKKTLLTSSIKPRSKLT